MDWKQAQIVAITAGAALAIAYFVARKSFAAPPSKAVIETKKTISFGKGQEIPLVGLGTWKSKPGEVEKAVRTALGAGYRHLDCAPIYGNEKEVGAALADSKIDRKEVFITSKLWNSKHSPEDVEPACRQTLADLKVDYLDLFLIHWPICFKSGDNPFPKTDDGKLIYDYVPLEDTWKAMESLVDKGLVRAIGVSNFNEKQLERILKIARIQPAMLQVECHPYLNQEELFNYAKSKGIAFTAYSPLGSPDRPWAGKDEPTLLQDQKVAKIAQKYNKSVAQILIRFQVQRGIVVIPKSANPERIQANLDVFSWSLTKEDMDALYSLNNGLRYCWPRLEINGKIVSRDAGHPEYPFVHEDL